MLIRFRLYFILVMGCMPLGLVSGEHQTVMHEIGQLTIEAQELLKGEISHAVEEGVQKGIQEGLTKFALQQDDDDFRFKIVKGIILGGLAVTGGYFTWKFLRQYYATPEDLSQTNARVQDHLHDEHGRLRRQVLDTLTPLGQGAQGVMRAAQRFQGNVAQAGENIDERYNAMQEGRTQHWEQLKARKAEMDQDSEKHHAAFVDGIGRALLLSGIQHRGLQRDIADVKDMVILLTEGLFKHNQAMQQQLENNREHLDQKTVELQTDLQQLAHQVPEIQELVLKSNADLALIWVALQKINEERGQQNTLTLEFQEKFGQVLTSLDQSEITQRQMMHQLGQMDQVLDFVLYNSFQQHGGKGLPISEKLLLN